MTESDGLRQRLITARSIRGLSQQGLAEASGVAAAQVSRYESGKSSPRPEVVAKLSKALDVDFDWLLSGAGQAPIGMGGLARLEFHGDPNSVVVPLASDLREQLVKAAASSNRDLINEIVSRLELSFSGDPSLSLLQRLEIAGLEQQLAALRMQKSNLRTQIDTLSDRVWDLRHAGREVEAEPLLSRIGQLAVEEADVKEEHADLMIRLDKMRNEDRPSIPVDD